MKPYILIIKAEDTIFFDTCCQSFIRLIDSKVDVPWSLVNVFLMLLKDPDKLKKSDAWEKAIDITKKTLIRLKTFKGYLDKPGPQKIETSKNAASKDIGAKENFGDLFNKNINEFLPIVVLAYLNYKEDFDKNGRQMSMNDSIALFYEIIEDYPLIQSKTKGSIIDHDKAVVAGTLARAAGFKLGYKENMSESEIYHVAYKAIKKNHDFSDTENPE